MTLDELEERLTAYIESPMQFETRDKLAALAGLVELKKTRELSSIREVLIGLRQEFSKTFEVK